VCRIPSRILGQTIFDIASAGRELDEDYEEYEDFVAEILYCSSDVQRSMDGLIKVS